MSEVEKRLEEAGLCLPPPRLQAECILRCAPSARDAPIYRAWHATCKAGKPLKERSAPS
mgnify:CR=1 FL=1